MLGYYIVSSFNERGFLSSELLGTHLAYGEWFLEYAASRSSSKSTGKEIPAQSGLKLAPKVRWKRGLYSSRQ